MLNKPQPGSFPCLMPGKDWVIFIDNLKQTDDGLAEKSLSLNLPYPDKHSKTTINYDGFSSHSVSTDSVSTDSVSAGQQNPPDHILVIPVSKQRLAPQYQAIANNSDDSPDSQPIHIHPNATIPDVLPETNRTQVSLPSHSCKPLLLELNRPHSLNVAEAERLPYRDGFVWIFLDPKGYVSIYPDPDHPPTSGIILHNSLQARCPVLARIDSEVISLTSHFEETSILTDTGKPYTIPESSMVSLKQNTDGTWVVDIHLPDGTIQSLSVDDYRRLRSIFWESRIAAYFGEVPLFAYGPHRNVRLTLRLPKAKGDKLDDQEPSDGSTWSTPDSDRSNQNFHTESQTAGIDSPDGDNSLDGEDGAGFSKNISQKESQKELDANVDESRNSSAYFWAIDFFNRSARNPTEANIRAITSLIKKVNLKETFTVAAREMLSSVFSKPLPDNTSLKDLIKSVLSVSSGAELLNRAGLINNSEALNELRSKKREVMKKTIKTHSFAKPRAIESGWGNNPTLALRGLEKRVASVIESITTWPIPVDESQIGNTSLLHPMELNFHETSITGKTPARNYQLINSVESQNRIRENCTNQLCTDQNRLHSRAMNITFESLNHDQPEEVTLGIRQIVAELHRIKQEIKDSLASTPEQSGILEQEHGLGWQTATGERYPITITPRVDFNTIRITRFKHGVTVVEVDITVPSLTRTTQKNFPEHIHLPAEETLDISGQLRIAIRNNDGQFSIEGGSLDLEGLELSPETIRQRSAELADRWYQQDSQSIDINLNMLISELSNFTQAGLNNRTSIKAATAILANSSRVPNSIKRLRGHQTEFGSELIKKLIAYIYEEYLVQWRQIKTYMKYTVDMDVETRTEVYEKLLPYYQEVPRISIDVLDNLRADADTSTQATKTALYIIEHRQRLRQATLNVRVSEGAALILKNQLEKQGKNLEDDEQERLTLLLSYGFIANRLALNHLSDSFQSLIRQYPALSEFEIIGTEHQPESPANLKTLIEEAFEKTRTRKNKMKKDPQPQ
ncbi:hypothetical protein [Endozoicomonas euniceicola]|uniref:Uncharacterized protein n=1 Tax=Endozoicomonas euniceicola TaxID=1234143 RepID=A0ABY6GMZ2_9GAMM|nr:hypothetical protein [Endozoicomonas euniceicola]UYM14099.1 hypothetical protein NX720_14400 [Endozoicomonas euniceicola]